MTKQEKQIRKEIRKLLNKTNNKTIKVPKDKKEELINALYDYIVDDSIPCGPCKFYDDK